MREVFWPISGYENYKISNAGRVVSTARRKKGETFLIYDDSHGYNRVTLCKNGETKRFLVHRLVAETFLLNKLKLEQVNHKDGNKRNNSVENLEWCSGSDNMKHVYRVLMVKPNKPWEGKFGYDNPSSIPIERIDLKDPTKIKEYPNASFAAKELNGNPANITSACRGRQKTSYGFAWRYKNG